MNQNDINNLIKMKEKAIQENNIKALQQIKEIEEKYNINITSENQKITIEEKYIIKLKSIEHEIKIIKIFVIIIAIPVIIGITNLIILFYKIGEIINKFNL